MTRPYKRVNKTRKTTSFNELTEDNNNKPPTIKITFANENDLQNAEEEIAKIVSKYDKAIYSVSAGEL